MAASISRLCTVAILCLLAAGCVSTNHVVSEPACCGPQDDPIEAFFSTVAVQSSQPQEHADVPVVRYGRYRLIEITPETAQSDLMAQMVDISIPATFNKKQTSVGDGIRYVLIRSGYRLCETGDAVEMFNHLPLPTAHTHIGPMMLKDALQMLAGSAWAMTINETVREVCFQRTGDSPFPNDPNTMPDNEEPMTEEHHHAANR
ncbi:PilL N-terminal domain-containing protein [Saezia sanguinis]|uniref:PFGI-1 class ICE element type IV pilus protein PilL2 n=1 Tax=Saezia sanguinis TaxID=1965230 RepID=UPI00302EAC67